MKQRRRLRDSVGVLELLCGKLEIDDAVEKGEDVCAECGKLFHRPVMIIEYGGEKVHPIG